MGSVLSSLMGFHITLIFLHQAKQRWLDEELLSLKLDGLSPFKLDGIADDSDLFHLAKQRWLDEEFLLCLKLDGLSPFKLDGIADDSDLLSSSQAEMA
jgi:RecB family exonuclease